MSDKYEIPKQEKPIKKSDIEDIFGLSPMQEGMLYEMLMQANSGAYHVQMDCKLTGPVHVAHFFAAWRLLCQRHTILRSAFMHEGIEKPVQVVLKAREPECQFVDLREDLNASDANIALGDCDFSSDKSSIIEQYLTVDLAKGFDLERDALMRLSLYQVKENEFRFVWCFPHILIDAWSMGLVIEDLTMLYRQLCDEGVAKKSLAPVVPWKNYIKWLKAQNPQLAKNYWQNYLSGYEEVVELPWRNPKPTDYVIGEMTISLGAELSASLASMASQRSTTVNNVFQAVWGLVLSRLTGGKDVAFGTVVSGRQSQLSGIENIVGLFINAIPVRVVPSNDRTILELIAELQSNTVASFDYQYLPLADIQQVSGLGSELFDHLLIFENYPLGSGDEDSHAVDDDLQFSDVKAHDITHYDFNLIIIPGDVLEIRVTWNADAFDSAAIQNYLDSYRRGLEWCSANKEKPVDQFCVLSPVEKNRLHTEFNNAPTDSQSNQTLLDVIAQNCELFPDAIAIRYFLDETQLSTPLTEALSKVELSYLELSDISDRIAVWLIQRYGDCNGQRVAVCLERSELVVPVLLGIMKTGAAWIPLEQDWPVERLSSVIQESSPLILLASSSLKQPSIEILACLVVSVDADFIQSLPSLRPGSEEFSRLAMAKPRTEDAAYIIFTSGSTGKPKGCVLSHGNLAHYTGWAGRHYYTAVSAGNDASHSNGKITGGNMCLFTAISFDLTITSLFVPLTLGKMLTVFPQRAELTDILSHAFQGINDIDAIKLTPSHISLLKDLDLQSSHITTAIVGGEALLPEQVAVLHGLNPSMRIENEYGPTETTVGCIVQEVSPGSDKIHIGKPISNTSVFILDSALQPVPVGIKGEICIAGRGVASGYFKREALTHEKFIQYSPNIDSTEILRMYKTGDLGCWLADGTIHLFGRLDDQVKIRGHRIELGEIEACISSHSDVANAVVQYRLNDEGHDELAAWYVPEAALPNSRLESDIRVFIAHKLPSYMLPSSLLEVGEISLTSNGKIDKRCLLWPEKLSDSTGTLNESLNELQNSVAKIWQRVLGLNKAPGLQDNFFHIGGHSLKAMQVVARLHKELGLRITLNEFFDNSLLRELANLLETKKVSNFEHIPVSPVRKHYPLSDAQKSLWLLQWHGSGKAGAAYNMPKAFLYHTPVDIVRLKRAFALLIGRHESLRTGFEEIAGVPVQVIHSNVQLPIAIVDLSLAENSMEQARKIASEDAYAPFDLSKPPLIRLALIRLQDNKSVISLTVNHIIGDGWSMNVIYQEIMALYEACRQDRPSPLAPLRVQYKDYTQWQLNQDLTSAQNYWQEVLDGIHEKIALPYDFPDADKTKFEGGVTNLVIEQSTRNALSTFAQRCNTTMSTLVLSVFNLFLYQLTRQEDIVIGMSVANRNHPDLENLIGFFVNILPIRIVMDNDIQFEDLVDQVAKKTQGAMQHQEFPFDRMVEMVNPDRNREHQPILNVAYGFQNFSDLSLDLDKAQGNVPKEGSIISTTETPYEDFESFDLAFKTAKFDLTLFVLDDGERLHLDLEYNSSLFLGTSASRQLKMLGAIMQQIAKSSGYE
jgi:amino acid adenylation domain-containing protein